MARRGFFEDPGPIGRAYGIELGGQCGGNLDGGLVRDQRNFFVRLNAQANDHRVARTFDERGLHGHLP
jgi:hypothetical protein